MSVCGIKSIIGINSGRGIPRRKWFGRNGRYRRWMHRILNPSSEVRRVRNDRKRFRISDQNEDFWIRVWILSNSSVSFCLLRFGEEAPESTWRVAHGRLLQLDISKRASFSAVFQFFLMMESNCMGFQAHCEVCAIHVFRYLMRS